MRICFDVETSPLSDAADYLPNDISAPANYRDENKIAAYIAEAQGRESEVRDPTENRLYGFGELSTLVLCTKYRVLRHRLLIPDL